jgi:transposase
MIEVDPMPNRLPMIHAAEWRKLKPHLPPRNGPGKPRQDDRLYVSAFFYAEACKCSLQSLPAGYGNASSLQSRRQRWTADGTLARLMEAGQPVIARMHRNFWGRIREHTIAASADGYRNSREFWGRGVMPKQPHLQPKGRYAADRRR